MKIMYRELNTLRILPLNFLKNLGILLKYDNHEEVVFPIIDAYYNWAMGKEIQFGYEADELYKAFVLLGDSSNVSDYSQRLKIRDKNNGKMEQD